MGCLISEFSEVIQKGMYYIFFFKIPGTIDDLLQTADVAMLLVANSNYCGMANYNSRTTPTGIAMKSCATGYYSFGHEIGHMLGAKHNKENSAWATFPYGYGYWLRPQSTNPKGGYRTIMG